MDPGRAVGEAEDQRQIVEARQGWLDAPRVCRAISERVREARRRHGQGRDGGLKKHVVVALATRHLEQLLEQHVAHPQKHHLLQPVVESPGRGGQIGPGEVWAEDPDDLCPELHDPDHDGRVHTYGFCKAQLIGEQVADFVLEALEEGSVTEETAALSFRTVQTYGQIQNTFYHAAGQLGVFPRALYHYDRDEPIDFDVNGTPLGEIADGNLPDLKTELATLRIGPAQIVTVPGELHPELYLGCYDVDGEGRGDCSYGETVVFPDGVGEGAEEGAVRPDLSKAPPPPYLIDLTDDDAEFRMVFGLTSDMIGYIMPLFNFALDPQLPYLEEAAGDHYEETNSIGPTAETQVIATLRKLLCWSEDGTLSEPCQQLSDWGWTPPVE